MVRRSEYGPFVLASVTGSRAAEFLEPGIEEMEKGWERLGSGDQFGFMIEGNRARAVDQRRGIVPFDKFIGIGDPFGRTPMFIVEQPVALHAGEQVNAGMTAQEIPKWQEQAVLFHMILIDAVVYIKGRFGPYNHYGITVDRRLAQPDQLLHLRIERTDGDLFIGVDIGLYDDDIPGWRIVWQDGLCHQR